MTEIIAGGIAGLLLGMAAQSLGLSDRGQVTASIGLGSRGMLRATLYALGLGAVLTAFLGWLAVIDVDLLTVLPLHGGTILGAAVFGVAAGLTGVTLGGALTMTGGGCFLEGLCAVIGCLAGAAALPWLAPVTAWAQGWFPAMDQTWFRVTLDEPYLFNGGFLGQACLGAVLAALAVILGPERGTETVPEPEVREAQPVSTDAREIREDTVVATLPGEEPVVVDTATPEEPDAEEPEGEECPADEADAEHADKGSYESQGARRGSGDQPPEGDNPPAGQDAKGIATANDESEGARPKRAGDPAKQDNPAEVAVAENSAQDGNDAQGVKRDIGDHPAKRKNHPATRADATSQEKGSGDRQGAKRGSGVHPPEGDNPPAGQGAKKSATVSDAQPVMNDHPELDAPPEDAGDWTEQMARLEEGAGQGTPVQEEALPVGARAVGEPERRAASEEDEHLG